MALGRTTLRENSIFERAGCSRKPNLVSCPDISQGTKEGVPMAGKAHVAGGAGKSGARDMPNGHPEGASIGTFEHPCCKTDSGNLDLPDSGYAAWPVYARGAPLIIGGGRTAYP